MSRTVVMLLTLGLAAGSSAMSRAQSNLALPAATAFGDISDPQVKPGQLPIPPPPPTPPMPAPAAPAPAPKAPPPPPPPVPPAPRKLVNIQLEFTITDQMGSGAPDKKTVSMIASDGTWGRIRASATARPRSSNPIAVSLNVDARPSITSTDAIQAEITIEYRPVGSALGDEPTRVDPSNLNQSLTVILQSGKAMVISQAADPVVDRKIVIEAKATVLK